MRPIVPNTCVQIILPLPLLCFCALSPPFFPSISSPRLCTPSRTLIFIPAMIPAEGLTEVGELAGTGGNYHPRWQKRGGPRVCDFVWNYLDNSRNDPLFTILDAARSNRRLMINQWRGKKRRIARNGTRRPKRRGSPLRLDRYHRPSQLTASLVREDKDSFDRIK